MRLKKNILITLVIPCHNEKDSVRPFMDSVESLAAEHHLSFEYLFINDGSQDETLSLLLEAQEKNSQIKILDLTRNFGKEAALTAGLDQAQGDVVIPIDVDGQDPVEIIYTMLCEWEQGAEHVIAIRKSRQTDSKFKRMTSSWFYQLFNYISDSEIPADGGDFRLLTRKQVEYIKQLRENNRFMKGIFSWASCPDATVYYHRKERITGEPSYTVKKLFILAFNGLFSFSSWPLRVWGFLGCFVSLGALVFGVSIVVETVLFGKKTPGYASIMVVMLFLGGVQLISLSVVGEYVARVFTEVKRRPLYLINQLYESKQDDK